ncbi:GNAT family N-acetyltransferase [Brevibacillus sp. SYSU BS000544]|uniref:GNAT family N-acetyltransferase n=1 Tax=Brevibacillus sp. SYSU BS000544 TaxID=3416443 RepID=UPI003CE4DCDD
MNIRMIRESDYPQVISVINDWWDGRPMADMLPKLFFVHFADTSFIVEQEDTMIGFLIGFISQSRPNEAYIHFVGVHPDHRKAGIAAQLYDQFFETIRSKHCDTIRCITSPINKTSIAFHQRMGFAMEEGTSTINGIPVVHNYDGKGNDRVLFVKRLGNSS